MNEEKDSFEIYLSESDDEIVVTGDLNEMNAAAFAAKTRELAFEGQGPLILNLRGLDIDDGTALAILVNLLRELRGRAGKLIVFGAPQMLGHNLYRVGMLEGPAAVELVDMRRDEPAD
jgi:anti-anti-sigma factor